MMYLSLTVASWHKNLTATSRFSEVIVPLYSGTPSASATYTYWANIRCYISSTTHFGFIYISLHTHKLIN